MIKENEWLEEIDRLSRRHTDGWTTDEMAAATGLSRETVRARLKQGMLLGIIAHAGFRSGLSIDGKGTRTPVYRRIKTKK